MSNTSLSTSLLAAAVVAGACATGALAQHHIRPIYETNAFDEAWEDFEDPGDQCWWDQFKHMKLNKDGSVWASLGGELRFRAETWNNFKFSDATDRDDTFMLGRVHLHGDLHFGDNIRVFVEGESAVASDRDLPGGRRTKDIDQIDLQNAFVDLKFNLGDDATLTTRLGRQEISISAERLVCSAWFSNAQRSHDAVRLIYNKKALSINAFYTRYTPTLKYKFNDWKDGFNFYGLYATNKFGEKTPVKYDLYLLGVDRSSAAYNGDSGAEDRYTAGARLHGKFGKSGFNYDFEGAYQFGDVGAADISAYMFASKVGYAFKESKAKTKFYIGFDYASGDDTAGDGDVGTFNQLLPAGHRYFGYMDFIGRQNITDLSIGFSFKPFKKVTFKADLHNFWRSDTDDAMYSPGGGVMYAGGAGTSSDIGQELDLTIKYKLDYHTTLQGGWSHFFAGDFIDEAMGGSADDMDWFYFQTVYRF